MHNAILACQYVKEAAKLRIKVWQIQQTDRTLRIRLDNWGMVARFWAEEKRGFMRIRKIAKSDYSFVMSVSVCPSVRVHGTSRLPMDGFSRSLIFEFFFFFFFQEIQVLLISYKKNGHFT
jgi:hypothetical protein